MPGYVRQVSRGRWQVVWGGKVTARGTSRRAAEAQLRLLRAREHGWQRRKKAAK